MVFVIAILIYCFLLIIKRILKPRTIPRLCDYDFENNTCFVIICILFIAYKLFFEKLTLDQLR